MGRVDGASRITDEDMVRLTFEDYTLPERLTHFHSSLQGRAQKVKDIGESLGVTVEAFGNMPGMTALKGLILSGEGPRSDFEYLRQGFIAAIPEDSKKIRDSIDPAFVGAVGAAKWAKFQVDHAETFFNEPAEHNEL